MTSTMIGMFRAEWMKTTRQGTNRVLLGAVVAVALLSVGVVFYIATGGAAAPMRQGVAGMLGFPNGLLLPLAQINMLAVYIAAIFAATVIGSEYAGDTWKNMLVRRPGRARFLAVKLVAVALALAGTVLVAMVVSQGLVLAGQALFASNADLAALPVHALTAEAFVAQLWPYALPMAGSMATAAAVAALFTVLGRSTVAGILVTILWQVADSVLGQLLPDVGRYLVTANLNSLTRSLTHAGSGAFDPWQSAVVLVVYTVVPLIGAVLLFRKRDMAG